MKHNALQKLIAKRLNVKGRGFNVVSSNRKGVPDIVGMVGMIAIAVEVKVGKDTLRPAQRLTLNDIVDKGGIGLVVHEKHLDIFDDYITEIEKQIASHTPCTIIGKPIPKELLADKPSNVISVTVEEL